MKNIHVLPTDKPSRLQLNVNTKRLILFNNIQSNNESAHLATQNIFITSDEEINFDEYYLGADNNIYCLVSTVNSKGKKIILTTDQNLIKSGVQAIDDEFLEWFVKNPSCEDVEVDLLKRGIYDEYKYKIVIPNEEVLLQSSIDGEVIWGTKLTNICIKCGVDLYATEGRFECQKHPKECKGIILPKETLQEWADKEKEKVVSEYDIMPNIVYGENVGEKIKIKAKILSKEEQKQHLIDMMKADEELGLYEEPKQHIEFINANIEEFDKAIELFKQETLEEVKQECRITKIMQMDAKMAYDSLPKQTDEKGKPMTYWGGLEKSKQEATPEEVAEYLGFVKGVKWQQEQFKNESTAHYIDRHIVQAMVEVAKQKMYSEEEVINIIYKIYDEMGISISLEDVLEQFKKK